MNEFRATIIGRYTAGPEIIDGEVAVQWKSERPEKRLAELAVLATVFNRWYNRTHDELVADTEALSR